MSHLAQLSIFLADKQMCTEEVGLDCIYDFSLLGFEKSLEEKIKRVEVEDPLEEVNLGKNDEYRPIYVSSLVTP